MHTICYMQREGNIYFISKIRYYAQIPHIYLWVVFVFFFLYLPRVLLMATRFYNLVWLYYKIILMFFIIHYTKYLTTNIVSHIGNNPRVTYQYFKNSFVIMGFIARNIKCKNIFEIMRHSSLIAIAFPIKIKKQLTLTFPNRAFYWRCRSLYSLW